MKEILSFALGVAIGFGAVYTTPSKKHEIRVSGAIAVYEGKATCEKALNQWVCNVRRN